jgi:heptosyltransferase-2
MAQRLIVRLPNWLGDTVMAEPALRALRAGSPDARLLVAGPWAHVLAGQGLADTLVVYPRSWRGRITTSDAVRGFHGDVAVLLPNSLESAVSARYWGAKRRVGFAVGGRAWLLTDRVPAPAPGTHQVDAYLRLVEHLGVARDNRVPALRPPPVEGEERSRVRALLAEVVKPGARIVGVHLGADFGASKRWPSRRVMEGCRALAAAGFTPVLLGAPRDADAAREIVAATGAASLVGRDAPSLLAALLSEIVALVAGDTGVSHLAAALGTPVVALFGPTDPVLTAPRGPATIVTHAVPCAPCFYRTCPIEHPCLDGVTGDAVTAAVAKAIAA